MPAAAIGKASVLFWFFGKSVLLLLRRIREKAGMAGCSAVRLAHLLWEQGVARSNRASPTIKNRLFKVIVYTLTVCFFIFSLLSEDNRNCNKNGSM